MGACVLPPTTLAPPTMPTAPSLFPWCCLYYFRVNDVFGNDINLFHLKYFCMYL